MNANTVCAASGLAMSWHQVNWAECHRQVRRLQARIVKATQEGRWNKVKALQWLLTHSWSGRVIAVKASDGKPRQENAGGGQSNMVNPGRQTSSRRVTQKAGLSTATTEAGFHTKKQREVKTVRNTDDEG